ncbi:2Fe-2S iron-sulfur cluster-binding protein [Actinacidiphila sp. ITFR-21]|uniref:2Fe-2S iron-sulfur cluster-binding protein n=1 Tax=Actinacidiphila sp. ITFR-21 TaxID=3075199 RepID=UPI00288C38BB|nr:2Fe-2S iron-sulfur cluster-binding protein [Streptomyces sp. ITFR-21]WNI18898.1 2Fe-2S iron-sulfur cluster-binding protein [Streptomyces sp. ITFR-21]
MSAPTAPTATAPLRPRTGFHALEVAGTAPAADDGSAVAVTLRVPDGLLDHFAFTPGQHVTVRADLDGTEVRRSYSLCSTPRELRREGLLRLGVRAVTGGVFSGYARERLSPGDLLELGPPEGRFTTAATAGRSRRYAAAVAGSGITPVLSLVGHVLAEEPESLFTVLYGNRTARSAMFLDELADLKDRHGARLQLLHFFSRDAQRIGPAGRRLDAEVLRGVLTSPLPPTLVDEWFVCGPREMVRGARQALELAGVPAAAVRTELFHTGPPPAATGDPGADDTAPAGGTRLEVRLAGRTSTVRMAPGQTVLDAALSVRPELPFSCRSGVCATCRAKVVSGGASMRTNFTLTAEETSARYVLTCQAHPTTPAVTVDYDVA